MLGTIVNPFAATFAVKGNKHEIIFHLDQN